MSLVVVGTVPSPVPLGVQATSTDAHRQVAPSGGLHLAFTEGHKALDLHQTAWISARTTLKTRSFCLQVVTPAR